MGSEPTWRDGRSVGRHILDRAVDYSALHRSGLSAAQIARRRKKSKGYVSIVLRLGLALRTLDREELAVFRSERITWKLAQRIVRAGTSDAEIQRQLRYALGGFSTHNIDRRKLRRHPKPAGGIPRAFDAAQTASASDGGFTWRWDAEWAARDPRGYVEAYRAHLASLHRSMLAHLGESLAGRTPRAPGPSGPAGAAPAPIPIVGQSLRHIAARIAREGVALRSATPGPRPSAPPTTADRDVLASLSDLDAVLLSPSSRERSTEAGSAGGDQERAPRDLDIE